MNRILSNALGLLFLLAGGSKAIGQGGQPRYENKGKLYVYWGWNKSAYSNSTIHFQGPDYDFTLHDVVATDRQSPLSFEYINPKTITIPQYNARIGYFINNNFSVSIGNDHMKYVVKTGQKKIIDGTIRNSESLYDGDYKNEELEISLDFLIFEHTDGLNYENIDFRRHDRLKQKGHFTLDFFSGVGFGIMYPKTNATLFKGERYDEFNVAGYGINGLTGLNLTYRGRYFMQVESKGGYVNLPNVRVSNDKREGAEQSFFFFQYNFIFGVNIYLTKD